MDRRARRFLLVLVLALAILTWAASLLVHQTLRSWFERDVTMRARLAVSGAREGIMTHFRAGDRPALEALLEAIARDDRIMAAAACGADGSELARTAAYPARFGCRDVAARAGEDGGWVEWHETASLPGGEVQLSVIPLANGDETLGAVTLVHDLSFVEGRAATSRWFLLVAFALLALAASAVTVIAARLSWRGWSDELRRLVRGDTGRPEFQPLLRDVRELVERISLEKEETEGGPWTPQRLKQTLNTYLHGEKVVILANREPYIHDRGADGRVAVLHPASGLVTALEPVMRACSGTWIAHGSGSADRETADLQGRVRVPPGEESYTVRRVWLSPDEERGYYYGLSNEGLWPLCHIADARPTFRREDWELYGDVNRRFADAVAEEVDSDDPIVLVQDYHFALAPRLIRERLPRATILTFWHIPWPNAERFGICPYRNEIIEGLLGSSIIGFHTQFHVNNFFDAADRFLESRLDRDESAVVQQGRATLVRPYPISVEWPVHWLRQVPPAKECRESVWQELRLAPDALLGVGVDRLDYTKGVEERLLAVERLLEKAPSLVGRFTFVQLAAPSRTAIERYRLLNENVERLAARINARYARGAYSPVVLQRSHHEPLEVFRYYRAADLCYVSSLHDGMNLVAKEYVAAREDERGVLVLSGFTGAAREMTEALIVNPYDLEEAASALLAALRMPAEEQRDRMRAMRAFVAEFNVYRWAGRMLADAARLRRRERLSGRLSERALQMIAGER